MFSKSVTNSSDFLMMSQSAQNLYFHFGMNADDDGFCELFTIMRMTDSKPDDLKSLSEKGLIYVVDSKICIVKDWHDNNQIRLDRYKASKYFDDPNLRRIYFEVMNEKVKEISHYKDLLVGLPNGNQMATQYSIGKVSKGKKNTLQKKSSKEEEPIGSKPEEPLEPKLNLPREIIMHYLGKIYGKDMPPLSPLIKRNGAAAKDLLEIAGSVERAKQEIDLIEKVYARKNLSWTLETIVKHWGKIGEPHYQGKPIRRGKNNTVEIEHNGKWVIADFQIKKEDITYE